MPINYEPTATIECDNCGEIYGEVDLENYPSTTSFLIGFDYEILREDGWQVLGILNPTIFCPNCASPPGK